MESFLLLFGGRVVSVTPRKFIQISQFVIYKFKKFHSNFNFNSPKGIFPMPKLIVSSSPLLRRNRSVHSN